MARGKGTRKREGERGKSKGERGKSKEERGKGREKGEEGREKWEERREKRNEGREKGGREKNLRGDLKVDLFRAPKRSIILLNTKSLPRFNNL